MILLLFGLVFGILIGRLHPGETAAAWLVVILFALRSMQLMLRRSPTLFPLLFLFMALGYLAISPLVIPEFPPSSVYPYLDGRGVRISGTIEGPIASDAFRTKCLLGDLHITERPQKNQALLPGRLRAIFYGPVPGLVPGDRLEVSGKIRPLKNFNNPGGFDYKQFMAYRQVWGTVYSRGNTLVIHPGPTGTIRRAVFNMRQTLDSAIAEVHQGERQAVLSALIVGKSEYITRGLREDFARAGASHLLAISGLHIGIIATCALLGFRWLLGRSSFLLRRAWVRKGAALLAFLPVIVYGMISGMSPSTQRAVIMVCVLLTALLFERDYDPANTLAVAAMAILVVSPQSLFSISFQLSFAAVCAILFGLRVVPGLVAARSGPPMRRIGHKLLVFTLVSAFAIAGTAPLVMHHFNQFSLIGIVANLLLIPLIGFAVIPIGLASALVYSFAEPLAEIGFKVAGWLVDAGLLAIHGLASLPFGAFRTITPSIPEMVCIYLLLYGAPFLWRLKRAESGNGRNRLQQGVAVSLTGLIILTSLILAGDAGYWIYRRHFDRRLFVTVLDVGQGSAVLLELPKGKTMLIDGGGFGNNGTFDVGAMITAPYLRRQKIRTVDTVLISHPDADHLNGLLHIMRNFKIGRVISTHLKAETEEYKRFQQILEEKGIPHPAWETIPKHWKANGVKIELLHPASQITSPAAGRNDNSIVVKASFEGKSLLFPGDIEALGERETIRLAGKDLAASLLLSPHHGSRTSSSPAFLDAVNPDSVFISVRQNRFGLPSPEVIERYERRGYRIFRTDVHGAVRIAVDARGIRIHPSCFQKGMGQEDL